MPIQSTFPSLGTKCGRRERESRREGRRDPSLRESPSRVVTVKGIPVLGKAAFFAERRRNADLGRSVVLSRVSPRGRAARRRQRMSGGRRGGERRRACATKRMHRRTVERSTRASGRRVLRSVLRPVRVDPHYARTPQGVSWWGVRIGITAGQTRASGRNQHWGRTDGRSRLAACHRSREGEGVARQKRKEVEASVPARIQEPGFVLARRVQLQKSVGDLWPRISSETAPQKGARAE